MKITLGNKIKWYKERRKLVKELKNNILTVNNLNTYFRLVTVNTVDPKDDLVCKPGMISSGMFQLIYDAPSNKVKIYVYVGGNIIRMECKYYYEEELINKYGFKNESSRTITFKDMANIDHIREKPDDYTAGEIKDDIDTITVVICSSMLYTLWKYVKRWY